MYKRQVRERLSLCYYASSGLMKYKDVMLVSSGVEFSKVGQAQDEILAQLQACKDGGFTDDELEWARRSVVSTLMTTLDAQSRLEDYWLGQAAAGLTEAPDELAQRVDITMANLSILKNNKARAVRFSTLEAICKALDCQPGDILEYVPEEE